MYHDSFDDNQEQVLDSIYQSSIENIRNIGLLNLNGTVKLFKELGRSGQAADILQLYIASQGEDRKAFDLGTFPFADEVKDPNVV
jgi:hypothetical protein